MNKKFFSFFLAVFMIITCSVTTVHAESNEPTSSPVPSNTMENQFGSEETTEHDDENANSNEVTGEDEIQEPEKDDDGTIENSGDASSETPSQDQDNVISDDAETTQPYVTYSLKYADGTSAENVTSSDGLSVDKNIIAVSVDVQNIDNNALKYSTYQSISGWQEECSAGESCESTDGELIEGFYAKLSDTLSENYNVEYRSYIAGFGWTAWAKNGEYTGSKDFQLGITSIDIRIVSNAIETYASESGQAYYERPSLTYSTHMQDYGWLSTVGTGQVSGKPNENKNLEALIVTLPDNLLELGNLSLKAHVQDYGWQDSVSSGDMAGTTGQNKGVEAIQLYLTGELANRYNILYQVYITGQGWQTTKKNGETAGTTGQSLEIQAICISIQYKNGPQTDPGMSESDYINNLDKSILYQAHVQDIGWQNTVMNYETSGTTGRSLRMEALRISLSDDLLALGGVSVRAHVQDIGWMSPVGNNEVVGTTGQSKQLEALQISLTGELANKFDIVYRTHVQDIGWQSWKKNGQTSGTTGQSKRIEAIQIAIVAKSQSGNTGSDDAERVEIGVDVSSWQGNQIDWNKVSGTASFAIIRAGYRGASGNVAQDTCAQRNVLAAKAAGLEVGLYFYSKATDIFQAMEEAELAASVANACGGIQLPIYFDMEDECQKGLSTQTRTDIANAFIDRIHQKGYNAGFYSYLYWLRDNMNMSALRSDSTWVAQYYSQCTYTGKYDFWQYTSQGSVPGINGNVDMDRRIR